MIQGTIERTSAAAQLISVVNSTNFGLGGSIWTSDERLASQIARGLECGTVWINQHGTLDPLVPFGGHKQSGIGCENGWAGVCEFTKIKVIHRNAPVSSNRPSG